MGKKLSVVIICVFIFSFLMASDHKTCEAKDKVIDLSFGADIPPMAPVTKVWKQWADEVNEKTGGRVKINMFFGQALVKGGEQRKALLKNIADIAELTIRHDRDNYQLSSVLSLPLMDYPDLETGVQIWYEIIKKFPEVKAEYKGTKILWINLGLPTIIHTKKKPVKVPDDLKGIKITGDPLIIQALGATPVPLVPPDVYMALERGIVDGELGSYVGPGIFKYMKLIPYHTELIINVGQYFYLFSERSWERLPPDIQGIFESLNEKYRKKEHAMFAQDSINFRQIAVDLKQTFITPTPEAKDIFSKKVRPMHEEWIAEREKKGLPARAVYEEVVKLIQAYSK